MPADPMLAELLEATREPDEHALAARYAPIVRFDAREPFLPLAAGYTIFRVDAPSPSFRRTLELDTPERQAMLAIEYAIWWDWDIGHLYELEHVWVYVDAGGEVVGCEASAHGGYTDMAQNGVVALQGDHPIVFSEPGKHAFTPDPVSFPERNNPHPRTMTGALAGCDGVLAPAMFDGAIRRTPYGDTLARTYLANRAFDPTWEFTQVFRFEAHQLVPWPALREWIPRRVEWWLHKLETELPANPRRALRIAHRPAPGGGMGNTLAAFRRAAERGADMVGVDLRITVDGVVVAATAPYGRDHDGHALPIATSTLDELRAAEHGDDLATLEQLCAECHTARVGLYAELHDERAIAPALTLIEKAHLTSYTIVGAYRPDWVAAAKAAAPNIYAALQFTSPVLDGIVLAHAVGADFVFPCWGAHDTTEKLDTRWIERAHEAGLGAIGWHSERRSVRDVLFPLGFDALCQRPDGAAHFASRGERRLLAICLDCGDTLVDEATEIKDGDEATLRATLIPGAATLVRELAARGYPLALVADGPAATFMNILSHYHLLDYFDAFAISEHVGSEKPNRRMFVHALDQLDIAPEDYGRTLMLGNFLARDIKGANDVGMISVWLNWSPRRPKIPADSSETPDFTITEPLQLLDVIDRIEGEMTR